jgi:hypothetical protein
MQRVVRLLLLAAMLVAVTQVSSAGGKGEWRRDVGSKHAVELPN